jgi:hypothetical protein
LLPCFGGVCQLDAEQQERTASKCKILVNQQLTGIRQKKNTVANAPNLLSILTLAATIVAGIKP